MPMGWSKGFMDDDGHCNKRRKFTQNPNSSTNMTGRYYTNKEETAKWVDGRIGLHCTLFEGISVYIYVAEKVLESNEDIVGHKVAENVLESKEDIDGHSPLTDIIKDKQPIQLCPCPPIATDVFLQMKISDKALHQKVDHMADEKVTESADKKTSTGFNDSKVKNKNDKFPSKRNLSKDSKILKFLFENGDNGVDDPREEVAHYGDIGVSYGELQCLRPTFPLLLNKATIVLKVINIFATYMNEPGKEDWYLPTFFASNLIKKDIKMSNTEHVERIRSVCALKRFDGRLSACRRIFIPLHEEGTNKSPGHWYLLEVHVRDRYAEILDSYPVKGKTISRKQNARLAMEMLDRVFGRGIAENLNPHVAFGTLPFSETSFGPIQRNTRDCGVFVIRNMQRYGTDWPAKYDSDGERASLVLECLLHQKNDVPDLHVKMDHALARWRGTVQGNRTHIGSAFIDVFDNSKPSGSKRSEE